MIVDIERLFEEQKRLSGRIILKDRFDATNANRIAGVDSSYLNDKIITAAVVIDYSSKEILEKEYIIGRVEFPYIPGLLFYREGKNTLNAIGKLKTDPDIIMVDGGGINHPRGLGLASHIGVILEKPTVGVTKKMFYGSCTEPTDVGESMPIWLNGIVIGYAYKSKKRTNPIYITAGNLISVNSAFKIAKNLVTKYKLPLPILEAHNLAKNVKLSLKKIQ